eukprot:gene23188-16995_t
MIDDWADELPDTFEDAGVVALNAARLERQHNEVDVQPTQVQLQNLLLPLSLGDGYPSAPAVATPDVPRCCAVGCRLRFEKLGARIGRAERVHSWWYGYEGRCLAAVVGLAVPDNGWCREDPVAARAAGAAAAKEEVQPDGTGASDTAACIAEGSNGSNGGGPAVPSAAVNDTKKKGGRGRPQQRGDDDDADDPEEDEDWELSPDEREQKLKEAAIAEKALELEREQLRLRKAQQDRAVACVQCMAAGEKLLTSTVGDHTRHLREGSWSRLVSRMMVDRYRQSRKHFPWSRVVSLLRSGDGPLQRVMMRALFQIAGLQSPDAAAAARKKARAKGGGWGAAIKAVDLKRLRRSSTTGTSWEPCDPDAVAQYTAMELVYLSPITTEVGGDAESQQHSLRRHHLKN